MKIVNPLSDENAYVYHYTTVKTALAHILAKGTLKFNPFINVNDRRESKQWDVSAFVRQEVQFDYEQHDVISNAVSEMLKSNAKLVCFSRDRSSAARLFQPLALPARGFAKPNMWYHYGGGYTGVCLMFNKVGLTKAFNKQLSDGVLIHGPVVYSDDGILPKFRKDPFVINLTQVSDKPSWVVAIRQHFELWKDALFLRKLTDWSNEAEYRWVFLDQHPEPRSSSSS